MSAQMTRRERILAAIRHEEVDRLPTDYWGTAEATHKIMTALGVSTQPAMWDRLGVDKIVNVGPVWRGPRDDMWGVTTQNMVYADGTGVYAEVGKHPLAGYETIDEIEANYVWPEPDMFDYSVIPQQCREFHDFAIEGGYISLLYFYDILRGIENMLFDLAGNPELAHYILKKLQAFSYEHTKKILEAADGRVDVSQVTDDFGSQSGLLVGLPMLKNYLSAYYAQNIALVKSFGAAVFHHDDGAMTEAMPWLNGMGIDILNPLQWHLPGWDLAEMKRVYGRRICFHGGIDNQFVLPFGTPDEVEAEVKACIDTLFTGRTGYILAPCHNVQVISPVENVVRMYEAAHRLGA